MIPEPRYQFVGAIVDWRLSLPGPLETGVIAQDAAVARVGDLLEPGQWSRDYAPRQCLTLEEAAQRARDERQRTYSAYGLAVPNALGRCVAMQLSGDRLGVCLLPEEHASWPGGHFDDSGLAHRLYLFSARDSAAMLSGMRRRLVEPMEELE